MPKRFAATLQFAVAFVLTMTLGATSGLAQLQAPLIPSRVPSGMTPQRPIPPRKDTRHMQSPFDRVIAPSLAQFLQGKKAVVPTGVTPKANATASGGSGHKLPTFVSAPYRTLNDGSGAYIANSATGDFNGDGKPDVMMVREDGTLDVILSPGLGIAEQTPVVSNATGNPLGLAIVSVVAADMNGDGKTDLVGQDAANSQTVVWISNGDGTFSAPHPYLSKFSAPTGSGVLSTVSTSATMVGDFNHDGTQDVVTLSFYYDLTSFYTTIVVQTLLNNGTGALNPLPEQSTLFKDFYTQNLANAAITTDGVDPTGIVFLLTDSGYSNGFNTGNDIVAMTSNGDGTFQAPVEPTALPYIPDDTVSVYASMLATNLTAKGPGQPTTDIVFLSGDGAVWDAPFTSGSPTTAHILTGANYWPNIFSTTGIPAPPTSFDNSVIYWMTGLNVADMNADGLEDLVVYTYGGILVFPNAGSGTFTAPPTQLEAARGVTLQAEPANYDGSGYNSLVDVDYYLGQVGYYQNLGAAASPQTGQFIGATVPTGTNTTTNSELFGSNFQVFATADINGDGILDVIGADTANDESNLSNTVVGLSNGSAPSNQVSNYTFSTIADSASSFNTPFQGSFIEPVTVSSAAVTDVVFLNTEYGIAAGGAPLYYVPVAKNGLAGAPQNLDFGAPLSNQCTVSLTDVGDMNGDGVPDIIAACGTGLGDLTSGYFTFLGKADGRFQPATFTPLGSALYEVKLINLTGAPGKLDLVGFDYSLTNPINPAFSVYVLPNRGDGSGTFDFTKLTKPVTNFAVTGIVAGDFNADGKQDLTLLTYGEWDPLHESPDPYTSGVLLIPGNGDYTFEVPTLAATGTYPMSAAYANFTGDGFQDLAMNVLESNVTQYTAQYAPMAQVLPNLGNGSFGPPVVEFHSITPTGQGTYQTTFVGPFTKSGGPDWLSGSLFGTTLYVNSGVTTMALAASSLTPAQGTPVTLAATISQVQDAGVEPTGLIVFAYNGTALGSATLANGVATLTTNLLPVGTDVLTATFAGDTSHNEAAASLTVTVAPVSPSFVLAAATPALTLSQGASGSLIVTVAGNSTFNGVVQLACSGAPSEVSCTPSPASITLGPGQSTSASILIVTTPPNNTNQANNNLGKKAVGGVSLAGLVLLLWPRRRKHLAHLLSVIAIAALALGSLGALSGCGGGSGNKYPGTVAGSYTLTVTAVSGGITQMQSIALAVTKP